MRINKDLSNLSNWLKTNKLTFDIKKPKKGLIIALNLRLMAKDLFLNNPLSGLFLGCYLISLCLGMTKVTK